MRGVVLCGGNSSRMGQDKGTLRWKDKTWAQCAAEKLSHLVDAPVLISIHPRQLQAYQVFFSAHQLITDHVQLNLHGPLLGLLSVHQRFPHEDLFVMACDLPDMHPEVMMDLIHHYQLSHDVEALVFKNEDHIETLCGIYTAPGLSKAMDHYNQNTLSSHSLRNALTKMRTSYVPLRDEWKPFFRNVNSQADLAKEGS